MCCSNADLFGNEFRLGIVATAERTTVATALLLTDVTVHVFLLFSEAGQAPLVGQALLGFENLVKVGRVGKVCWTRKDGVLLKAGTAGTCVVVVAVAVVSTFVGTVVTVATVAGTVGVVPPIGKLAISHQSRGVSLDLQLIVRYHHDQQCQYHDRRVHRGHNDCLWSPRPLSWLVL